MRRYIARSSQEKRQYPDDAAAVDADKEMQATSRCRRCPMDRFTDSVSMAFASHVATAPLNPRKVNLRTRPRSESHYPAAGDLARFTTTGSRQRRIDSRDVFRSISQSHASSCHSAIAKDCGSSRSWSAAPFCRAGRSLRLAQSPFGLRLRDQIRVKVSASSSSNRLA